MAEKAYDKMNKNELLEAIKFFKLNDKANELAILNERKDNIPTNADYVTILNEFKDYQAEINKSDDAEVGGYTGSSNKSVEQLVIDDVERKVMVIVHDHNNTQTTEEDLEGLVYEQGWGNMLTSGITSRVALNGRPQYLQRGAILAIEEILIPTTFKDNEGKENPSRTKKRFVITEVEGWDEDKLKAHMKAQKLKQI